MKVSELCKAAGFTLVCDSGGDREVGGVYACDLLSWVIGRAAENAALVTVMTNVNVIAVAVMADLSCVVLSEGVRLDDAALLKAQQNGVAVLSSDKPTFETCLELNRILNCAD
jgi:hypothetical protein